MRIGAKIILNLSLDAARGGLAALASQAWVASLPEAYHGHPAGQARPGTPAGDSLAGLVMVTFGAPTAACGSAEVLPVHWESVEQGEVFAALLLSGDLTVSAAATPGQSTLALFGFCSLLPAVIPDAGHEQAARRVIKEAARLFITSVAATIARSAGPGHERPPLGPASSWLTGQRSSA
jgi:hypothetical protein